MEPKMGEGGFFSHLYRLRTHKKLRQHKVTGEYRQK